MSDAKEKIKEGIDDAAVKTKQVTEGVVEKSKAAADEKKIETADAWVVPKRQFLRASIGPRK